jgi:hypothetical protein
MMFWIFRSYCRNSGTNLEGYGGVWVVKEQINTELVSHLTYRHRHWITALKDVHVRNSLTHARNKLTSIVSFVHNNSQMLKTLKYMHLNGHLWRFKLFRSNSSWCTIPWSVFYFSLCNIQLIFLYNISWHEEVELSWDCNLCDSFRPKKEPVYITDPLE